MWKVFLCHLLRFMSFIAKPGGFAAKTFSVFAYPDINKPETKSRVCIPVENSPNPSSVYIRLCKHKKKVFYCFYKITSSKTTTREKIKLHFTDQNVSSYNINLTMTFLN